MAGTDSHHAIATAADAGRTRLRHAQAPPKELWGHVSAQQEQQAALAEAGFVPDDDPVDPDDALPQQAFLGMHRTTPPAVFTRAVASLRDQHSDVDILHPAARAKWLDLPDTGRFAVTGFAGHGNMLLHALLSALDEHALGPEASRAVPDELEALKYDAAHHGQALQHALTQLHYRIAEQRGTTVKQSTVTGSDRVDAAASRVTFADGQTLLVEGVPYAGFVLNDYGAHVPWDADAVRFFEQTGYRRVYCVVREPLAGIASNAAKTLRPCEPVLHHPAWLDHCATTMADFLQQVDQHREHFRLVRFEDILNQPVPTLHRLARDAGYELTDEEAKAIWGLVGFKPLTPAGREHLVDPLGDKHRLFRRSKYPQLEATGIFRWFEPFGYDLPNPNNLPDEALIPLTDDLVKSTPSLLYGRPDPTRLIHRPLPELRLDLRATDEGLAEVAAACVQDAAFVAMLRSLGDGILRRRTAHAL
ncbi:MAG: hypothetical protein AAF916_07370 [Planctomycetota bacterium]